MIDINKIQLEYAIQESIELIKAINTALELMRPLFPDTPVPGRVREAIIVLERAVDNET